MKLKCAVVLMITISLVFSGCEEVVNQPAVLDKLSLVTIFSTSLTKQNIFLYKSAYLGGNDSLSFNDYFVENAAVSIISANRDTLECILKKGDDYMFSVFNNRKEIQFKPGETYRITAKSEFGAISGETTFPGDYEIINPQQGDFYVGEEYRYDNGYSVPIIIQWNKSRGAYGYFIEISGERGSNDFFTTDTAFTTDFNVFYTNTDLENYTVTITAIDKNYYRHHFQQYHTSGISGGYGVMGSGSDKEVKISFIKKNP